MLPRLGVVDEPLLLSGRHLALLLLVFQTMQRTICGHPICDLQLTLFGGYRDALAVAVVHHRTLAALLDCFIASGEWFDHCVLLTDGRHIICWASVCQPVWLHFFNCSFESKAFTNRYHFPQPGDCRKLLCESAQTSRNGIIQQVTWWVVCPCFESLCTSRERRVTRVGFRGRYVGSLVEQTQVAILHQQPRHPPPIHHWKFGLSASKLLTDGTDQTQVAKVWVTCNHMRERIY